MIFIHSLTDVAECQIGESTRIWQFVLKGVRVGGVQWCRRGGKPGTHRALRQGWQ